MAQQGLVHLQRGHFLAAPVDLLLESSGQEQVAVVVEVALVAGAEPAVGEGGRVGVGVVLVAVDHRGALDGHLAALPRGQDAVVAVENGQLDAGGDPHRPGLGHRRRQRVGAHLVGGLGHAVGLDHRRSEQPDQFLQHRLGQRRRRRAHEPQARLEGRVAVAGRPCDHHLVHGRHRGVVGRVQLGELGEEPEGVEALGAGHRAAGRQRGQEPGQQPVNVEQRHHLQRPVGRGQGQRLGDAGSGAGQVPLAERHDLGPRRGPGGVQDQGDVVGGRPVRRRGLGGRRRCDQVDQAGAARG